MKAYVYDNICESETCTLSWMCICMCIIIYAQVKPVRFHECVYVCVWSYKRKWNLCAFMNVYMYVYDNICHHTHIHTIWNHTLSWMCICTNIHMVCAHMCMIIYSMLCVWSYMCKWNHDDSIVEPWQHHVNWRCKTSCIYSCMYVYMYTHIHVYVYVDCILTWYRDDTMSIDVAKPAVYIRACTCICIHTYMYMYMYMLTVSSRGMGWLCLVGSIKL